MSEKGLILRGWYIKHNNPQALMIYYHENAGSTPISRHRYWRQTLLYSIATKKTQLQCFNCSV